MLVKDETVDHCDVEKMEEEDLVPFCGLLKDIIILYKGIREINTSHIFAVVLHSRWNRDLTCFPNTICTLGVPGDCIPRERLVNCGTHEDFSRIHPFDKQKRTLSTPSDGSSFGSSTQVVGLR